MMPFGIMRVHGDGTTAFRNRATDVLELDGGVEYVEAFREHLIEAAQDAVAGRRRHVVDEDVAAQGVGARSEAPDVKVMNVENAVERPHGRSHITEFDAARQAF